MLGLISMKAKRKNLIKLKIDSINTFVLLNTYNDRETFEYDYISGNRCITINSIFNNSISFGLNLDSTDEEKEYTARLHNIKTYNRLIKRIKEIESYRKSKENDNLLNYLNNEVCRAFNEWFNKKGINYKIFIGYDVFDKLDEIIWEYIDDYVKNENYFRTIEFFNGTETERYDKLMEYKANLHDRI